METHQACLSVEGQVERGDVREADEDLGMGTDRFEVQPVEDPHGAVAAGAGEDGIDFRIEKGLHQLLGAPLVGSSEIAVDRKEVFAHLHL